MALATAEMPTATLDQVEAASEEDAGASDGVWLACPPGHASATQVPVSANADIDADSDIDVDIDGGAVGMHSPQNRP